MRSENRARESRDRLWSRDRHYYKSDLRTVVSEARRTKELALKANTRTAFRPAVWLVRNERRNRIN